MQGTGTQADPFIVTTANELVEAWQYEMKVANDIANKDKIDGFVYIELSNDIDFNNSDYYNIKKSITNKTIDNFDGEELITGQFILDGKGHKISNIYSNDVEGGFFLRKHCLYAQYPYSVSPIQIKNVIIEAILIANEGNNCTLFSFDPYICKYSSENIEFTNVDFRIKFYKQNPSSFSSTFYGITHVDTDSVKFIYTDCVFNIDIYQTSDYRLFGGTGEIHKFYYCQFNINIYTFASVNYGANNSTCLAAKSYIFYCAIFINIYANNNVGSGSKYIFTIGDSSGSCVMTNSYVVVRNKNEEYKHIVCDRATHSSCFVDNEVLGGDELYYTLNPSGLHRLTTAQCKDAKYLESIGFVIARDT